MSKSRKGITTSLFSRLKCGRMERQLIDGRREIKKENGEGEEDHFLSPRRILFRELKSFGEAMAMARRRFYRWNFVFSEKTFEESFRDSASRRKEGTIVANDGVTKGVE